MASERGLGGASSAKILLPPPTSQLTWALLRDLTGKLRLTNNVSETVDCLNVKKHTLVICKSVVLNAEEKWFREE
jgi:hypothetical protein